MEYRVERLASACDVSVDTIRYYQSKGLLAPPKRKGRVALYGAEHAERIRRIRELQRKGLTLVAVRRVLEGGPARADVDLAGAVAEALVRDSDEFITLDEVAERSGVPAPLLAAVERDGLSVGRVIDGRIRYTVADAELLQLGLKLLEAGLPLGELLALARDHDAQVRAITERAVELFDEHVRKPIGESAASEDEAAERLVAAFREMLPAVTALVANHFRRTLLAVAERRLLNVGARSAPASPKAARRPGATKRPGAARRGGAGSRSAKRRAGS